MKIAIATGLCCFPLIVAMALSSAFQDPMPLLFDLFGWVLCIFAALYLLIALIMKPGKPFIAKSLLIISPILLLTGQVLALYWFQPPVDNKPPEAFAYYKFVHVEDVYVNGEGVFRTGYRYQDAPFTQAETDTLIRILADQHKTFIIGKNGEILISKSMITAMEMSIINQELADRMNKK